jgi:hypothetical protein
MAEVHITDITATLHLLQVLPRSVADLGTQVELILALHRQEARHKWAQRAHLQAEVVEVVELVVVEVVVLAALVALGAQPQVEVQAQD